MESTRLDAALSTLSTYQPEYSPRDLSSHVPMVVEALDRLGAPEQIAPYLAAWLPRLRARTAPGAPETFWDQVDQAAAAIDELGPSGAVAAWLPRFGPGLVGAAFHGILRVGHAVRAIGRGDHPARRGELAHALAYATIVAAPVPAITGRGDRPFADVLAEIAPATARPRPMGLITPQLRARVPDLAGLAATLGGARLPADPVAAARELRDAAATMFACGRFDDGARFTLLHGVTGMDAVVAIAAAGPAAAATALIGHAAVALAALTLAFGGPIGPAVATPPTRSAHEQRVRAVASLDDHAVKLAATVAAARADGAPTPHYDAALERWLVALGA